MTQTGKHQKRLQILVIPDDQTEPKTLSISRKHLKWLKWGAIAVVTHIVLGAVSYGLLFSSFSKNRTLEASNRQLEENNAKVYELLAAFEDLEKSQTKIRSALGLGRVTNSDLIQVDQNDTPDIIPEVMPVYRSDNGDAKNRDVEVQDKLGFLQQEKSGIHDYLAHVPTYLPVEGVLTSDFGDVRSIDRLVHRGIDIAAPRGSFIRSAADGLVVFSGWTYNLGELIIIYHGGGYFTYYGHNQNILVKRNMFVKKGESIATLGNTGESSAPHLHFEIWRDGVPLDPKDYILAFSEIS